MLYFVPMQLVVLANAFQKKELLPNISGHSVVIWINHVSEFLNHAHADAFIDLQFINEANRKNLLKQLLPRPVVVESVVNILAEINPAFTRFNGWNTFLSGSMIEAACASEETRLVVSEVFSIFNKKMEWLPDEPGFITPRVISMIVNEAYLSLQEGVSTKQDIDTAMKLGTNYPYGPFEWAQEIGLSNIVTLLKKLSEKESRYKPAEMLVQELNNHI